MNKLLLLLLLVLSIVVPSASATAKGSPAPLSFYLYQVRVYSPVDFQTWCGDCINGQIYNQPPADCAVTPAGCNWTVNPETFWPYSDLAAAFVPPPVKYSAGERGCGWDSDDQFTYLNQGNVLNAGASVTVKSCFYQPPQGVGSGPNDVYITSSSPDLTVQITWTTYYGTVFTHRVVPTFDSSNHNWLYRECLLTPHFNESPVVVPDSNNYGGSSALPMRITYTVGNPTSKKVSQVAGAFDYGNQPGINRGCADPANYWHYP